MSSPECPEGWREDKPSSDSNLFPIRTILLEQNKHPSRVTFCCCYCGNISVHHSWQNTKELVPVFVSFSLLFSARRAQASTINAHNDPWDLGLRIRLSWAREVVFDGESCSLHWWPSLLLLPFHTKTHPLWPKSRPQAQFLGASPRTHVSG